MKNYPTSSSMFSLSSSPLFHTSGTITATTATPATAAVATFDSSPSTLNNASSLSMMSKKNYAIPSSSSMVLPLSLSSPIFPTSKNTIAISNCTAIATAIAIATETTATDDSDSDTATDDSNTDTDNDDSPALPEPSLLHQQQHRDQHRDQHQDQVQRKKSRSVHFLSMVAVRKTISRHEMTQEEKYNCWFQANEYLMIKQNNYDTIITNDQQQLLLAAAAAAGQGSSQQQQQQQQHSNILHNSNNNDNMDSESSSSLESESIRKKTYRLGALEEVFIEQEEQYLGDYYNDEAIAYAYYSVSNECQLHAERIAIQDRKDIEEYIYEGLYETI